MPLAPPQGRIGQPGHFAPQGAAKGPWPAQGNPSASSFTPSSVAGLVGWWDFSDISTLFQLSDGTIPVISDGHPVGYVTDKSASLKHFTQATVGARPLYKTNIQNGRSVVLFDGTDDFMENALAVSTAAAYVLAVFNLPTSNRPVLDGLDGTDRLLMSFFVAAAGEFGIFSGGSGFDEAYTAAATYHLWEGKYNGAASAVLMDGAAFASGTTGTNTTAGLTLGSAHDQTSFSASGMGELLIFSEIPSAGNLALLRTYLNGRWATY